MRLAICFVIIVATFAIAAAIHTDNIERHVLKNFEKGDTKTLFKVYHSLYKKTYEINSEEAIRRYRILSLLLAELVAKLLAAFAIRLTVSLPQSP